MDRTTLIIWSVIADILEFIAIGQAPVLSWIIDIPVIIMHVSFGGLKGLATMFELVPVVGTIPLFTISAIVLKRE
ncbi:MAG: hypothetical protein KGP27_11490 [Hyphomicrobiales bacterium]|nr:hypothetical protein [Hyphomicrobiales bacterium]